MTAKVNPMEIIHKIKYKMHGKEIKFFCKIKLNLQFQRHNKLFSLGCKIVHNDYYVLCIFIDLLIIL